jgi:hypothetical protein
MDNKQQALSIVQEQLTEKNNYVARSTAIYYTLIGHNVMIDIERIYNSLQQDCHLLRYAKHGNEGLTLQSLYKYCRDDPEALVTYIHDKGSFHNHPINVRWQQMVTKKAAFSNEYQNVLNNNNNMTTETQCTSCLACFAPFPYAQHTGNMWTASCSYIQKLLPPLQFPIQMESLVAHVIGKSKTNCSIPPPTNESIHMQWKIGTGRFALEHWVASHPLIQPCDVYPNVNYLFAYQNLPTSK